MYRKQALIVVFCAVSGGALGGEGHVTVRLPGSTPP